MGDGQGTRTLSKMVTFLGTESDELRYRASQLTANRAHVRVRHGGLKIEITFVLVGILMEHVFKSCRVSNSASFEYKDHVGLISLGDKKLKSKQNFL